ncbi:arginine-tRNA-protein transferase, partial [Candidatus Woesearchaeota archaeon]|nr:arginine-tRNA-protein transferase [Candidatus Woesearchaeota archaeon]
MKEFKSEFSHSYSTYSFGYANYAIRENKDALADIYTRGYLPYTGSPNVKNTLYMARSARVDLKTFSPNSENRRILKKFDGTFERATTPLGEFDYKNKNFLDFCLSFFSERHGPDVTPEQRLLTIL